MVVGVSDSTQPPSAVPARTHTHTRRPAAASAFIYAAHTSADLIAASAVATHRSHSTRVFIGKPVFCVSSIEPPRTNMSDWQNNLIRELHDPTKWIHWSKDTVVVRDRYPKAMYHFLVMPKADIPSIFDVSAARGHFVYWRHFAGLGAIGRACGNMTQFGAIWAF